MELQEPSYTITYRNDVFFLRGKIIKWGLPPPLSDLYWLKSTVSFNSPLCSGVTVMEISPATPSGFGPLWGGPVILLTLFRRAWNTTRRRPGHGMVHGRTASCPLLTVRMPAPTVAGGRLPTSDAVGVYPLRLGRREDAVLSLSRPAPSFTSIAASQKEVTAFHSVSPRSMSSTNAGRERSPPIAAVRTRRCSAKLGSLAPCALLCPPGDLRSGDTQAFPPFSSDTGTSRNFRVRWGPASCGR